MSLSKKFNATFILVITIIMMIPVVYVAHHYNNVYDLFNAFLGTLGLALLVLLAYVLLSYLHDVMAKTVAILLFFVLLLTRIIQGMVYDFSGRGFTSEFFAHFSWDSFLIGLDEYGTILFSAVFGLILFALILAKMLNKSKHNGLVFVLLLMAISSLLIVANNINIPEYRLMSAFQQYNKVIVETSDVETIRKETIKTLMPIRKTNEIPLDKKDVTASLPDSPKNLILIYLESFSDVLTTNPRYPKLTPHLDQLKKDHFSFENYYSGGYVTIEGIANSQCGTLMNMDSGNNSLTSSAGRLPNLPCLGDILKVAGYKQVFMGGADLEFAGKGAFFIEHGYDETWGKLKWEELGFESANTWGLSDADLFAQALEKIKKLSQSPQPFNVTLLTLGTHIPGFVYEGCVPYGIGDTRNSFIDGIHCTDHLVGNFIKQLDDNGLLKNTVVQIQGDHGIFPTHEMKTLFGESANTHRIYNTTIHPNDEALNLDETKASTTLNSAANILDMLEIKHNVEFILSYSDFQSQSDNPYIVSRYTDFHSGEKHFNGWGESSECNQENQEVFSLPLNHCNKKSVLKALYRLGSTYSSPKQNQNVCVLGSTISIDKDTKKIQARWGNLNLTDQFIASGRTFTDPKPGFYLLELNTSDLVTNQVFFDHLKPREMNYLADILSKEDNRYFLISNLHSKTIEKLDIENLPDSFAQHKILYSQNTNHQIVSLFDKPYLTGNLSFIPESCFGKAVVSSYEPNPDLDTVKFCDIDTWGPQQMVLGESFNEQPNGDSAFWFKTSCAPTEVQVYFNGVPLKTVERLPTITARIDTDVLIQHPGKYAVEFVHPETESTFSIGEFNVLPNEAYKPELYPKSRIENNRLQPPLLISHAGGGINGSAYMNSIEALNHNYQLGHRFFEIDFNWTSDNQLVAIHDWESTYQRLFESESSTIPTHKTFMSQKMRSNQSQLDLKKLDSWLANHQDAYIITDIKERSIEGLKSMVQQMSTAPNQIIPQMYHQKNYTQIKALGYNEIIFTLYATRLPYFEIIDFVKNNQLFALTIHPTKKNYSTIVEGATKAGTFVYVHTFNTIAELKSFRQSGVDGIYTDFLYIDDDGHVKKQ